MKAWQTRGAAVATFAWASAACACSNSLPPTGEVVIAVDTDATVPNLISRLRVDLYTTAGDWYESRDYPADDPTAWPLSFAVVNVDDAPGKVVRVRLRAYLAGHLRDERGQRPRVAAVAPTPAASDAASACRSPPSLKPYPAPPLLLRGSRTRALPSAACISAASSAAFQVDIATGGRYVLSLLDGGASLQVPSGACGSAETSCSPAPRTLDLSAGSHAFALQLDAPWLDARVLLAAEADVDRAKLAAFGPPPTGAPRLFRQVGGADETPPSEPEPATAIDRIFDVEIVPQKVLHVRVPLWSRCFGVDADLSAAKGCIDAGVLSPFDKLTATADRDDTPSRQGTMQSAAVGPPCPSLDADHVCIPGGILTMGDPGVLPATAAMPSAPERFVIVGPLIVDKYEYTIARYQRALSGGFAPPDALGSAPNCTFGSTNGSMPLNCVSWTTARALCKQDGGDLPTEAEWEWIASTAGFAHKQRYPWGNDGNGCTTVNIACTGSDPSAIAAVDDPRFGADHTPLGVYGMTGNLLEWVLDRPEPFDGAAWRGIAPDGASVRDDTAGAHVVRGLAWGEGDLLLGAATRRSAPTFSTSDRGGFRCVRHRSSS